MGGRTEDSEADQGVTTAGERPENSAGPGNSEGDGPSTASKSEEVSAEPESLFNQYEQLTLGRVIVAIALLAIVLRIVTLGSRTAHWDEARVAYWSYFYTETGSLAYYWEEHGPVAQLAAARMFGIFGVNDFAARLPIALVGGLFPLAALLYREHLRRSETVALALFLALNSVLLYYSRFMRSDILVAAFMFVALGLLVRYYDTRKVQYLLVAGIFLGLGFGSKENAIVYLLTWLGAAALLTDQYLHSPASDESGFERVRANFDSYRNRVRAAAYRADYAIGLFVTFMLTMVVVFAPRGQGIDRRLDPDTTADPVTIGSAIRDPTTVPTLIDESLTEAYSGYMDWFAESEETTLDTYISFLTDYVMVLVEYAPLVTVFAILGIVIERYARDRSRALVMFMAYCGVASLIGYPLGSHIQGDSAWLAVHVIVPLLVPAAVGLSWTFRRGRELAKHRSVNPGVVLVILLLFVSLWAWFLPMQAVYVEDTDPDNRLVQFAQPHSDLGPLVETMDDIATETEGTDVVIYYGEDDENFEASAAPIRQNITRDFTGSWQVEPTCSDWATTQPLNWYFAVADAEAGCERSPDALAESISEGEVPMVITVPEDTTVPDELQNNDYVERSYYLRSIGQEVVVYTDRSWERERYSDKDDS